MSRPAGRPLELVAWADARGAESPSPDPRFDALYASHAGYVAGLAGRILGRDDEVADLVQEVFLVAHRRMRDLREPEAARAWLATITVRKAGRKLRWRRLWGGLGLARDVADQGLVDPKGAPELRPLAALLYVTLDRLPRQARIAWVLRNLMDEPLDSVAELSGCSLATAKRRIAAADRVLRPIVGNDEPRIPERQRRRRQLARVALAFVVVSAAGVVYAWVGGRLGDEERAAPPVTSPGPAVRTESAIPAATKPPAPPELGSRTSSGTPAPFPRRRSTRRRPEDVFLRSVAPSPRAGDPEDPIEARFAKADRARSTGRPAEAVVSLMEIVEQHAGDPRAAIAAFQLGRVYADELGDPARAARAFDRARSLSPDGPLADDARQRAQEALRSAASASRGGSTGTAP